ncbi:hypothetical protein ACFYOT_41450 [Saccharothrix saharensis]|uniref:hypothetical protein n=1 Tax=Saccharothrix saharensis TaxID=571190 RepID=UPI00369A1FB5
MRPSGDPAEALVRQGRTADITTAVVDGRILLTGRTLVQPSARAAVRDALVARARAAGTWTPTPPCAPGSTTNAR